MPGNNVATRRGGEPDLDRIFSALVGCVESLDLLDGEAIGDSCLLEIRHYMKNRRKANQEAEDKLLYPQVVRRESLSQKCMRTGRNETRAGISHRRLKG